MVDPQNAHVGAPPCAALFDGLGRDIENTHKRNGSARYAGRAEHHIIGRTEP
jgi:hypothetical protein